MSFVDGITDWVYDRVDYAITKARPRKVAPPYIARELGQYGFTDLDDILGRYDEKKLQYMAMAVPWIYSNVDRIAKEVSMADFQVIEKASKEKDIQHDFEQLLDNPNPFFGRVALFQYLIWALYFDNQGAYWWLAPNPRNSREIREIWPIQVNRITPIKHKDKFISGYLYKTNDMKKPLVLDPRYVVRFFFPNPFNLYESLTPLAAANAGMSVYEGIKLSQSSLYNEGRGIPLSVVTVDANISESDFNIAREVIKEDWAKGRRIAIARAGTIDVKSVGISNRDLETVATQQFNQEELDSVYMGFPWRGKDVDIKESGRQIKESVIYPLHQLLAAQIQVQAIERFYGEKYLGRFSDVRQTDEALKLQSYNVTWRAMTLNEARRDLGKKEFEHPLLGEIGNLPLEMATNVNFVSQLFGIKAPYTQLEQPDETGNIIAARDPEATANQLARGGDRGSGINIKAAIEKAQQEELKTWRTVVLRAIKRNGTNPQEVDFDTEILPPDLVSEIKGQLEPSEESVKAVFSLYIA